jgi:hypothetical protein
MRPATAVSADLAGERARLRAGGLPRRPDLLAGLRASEPQPASCSISSEPGLDCLPLSAEHRQFALAEAKESQLEHRRLRVKRYLARNLYRLLETPPLTT